jgi:hypothetical protein
MSDLEKVATKDNTPAGEAVLLIVDETLVTKEKVKEIGKKRAIAINEEKAATAQELRQFIDIENAEKAAALLKLGDSCDTRSMLVTFEQEIRTSIENKKTRMLKPLTEAKLILLRQAFEQQIAETGKFTLDGIIPFKEEDICPACHGAGELLKFFRKAATVPCKFCITGKPEDNGYVFIECRSCKGSKRYKKYQKDLVINVACTRCQDADGNPTGQERVRCRACLGKGIFRKLVIDAKIKSTTHCRHCKGRGFLLPEPPAKKIKTQNEKIHHDTTLSNPVISADLGAQIKGADIKE